MRDRRVIDSADETRGLGVDLGTSPPSIGAGLVNTDFAEMPRQRQGLGAAADLAENKGDRLEPPDHCAAGEGAGLRAAQEVRAEDSERPKGMSPRRDHSNRTSHRSTTVLGCRNGKGSLCARRTLTRKRSSSGVWRDRGLVISGRTSALQVGRDRFAD